MGPVGGKAAQALGEWGEHLVAKALGYRRQPGSGSRWPQKQDLYDPGPVPKRPVNATGAYKRVAQVKTTERAEIVEEWLALQRYAEAESADPFWYIVVKTPGAAYIFEQRLIKEVLLGIGGDE